MSSESSLVYAFSRLVLDLAGALEPVEAGTLPAVDADSDSAGALEPDSASRRLLEAGTLPAVDANLFRWCLGVGRSWDFASSRCRFGCAVPVRRRVRVLAFCKSAQFTVSYSHISSECQG